MFMAIHFPPLQLPTEHGPPAPLNSPLLPLLLVVDKHETHPNPHPNGAANNIHNVRAGANVRINRFSINSSDWDSKSLGTGTNGEAFRHSPFEKESSDSFCNNIKGRVYAMEMTSNGGQARDRRIEYYELAQN